MLGHRRSVPLLLSVVLCGALSVALAGCGSSGSNSASSSSAKAHYKIFAMPPIVGQPYPNALGVGAMKGGKELGDTVTYRGPTTLSPTQQVSLLNTAMEQGYQGLLVGPDDPAALEPTLRRAEAKGIKVVTWGGDVADPSTRSVYIGETDYKKFGYDQIQWICQEITGCSGQIAILSSNTTKSDQVTVIKYMKEALQEPKYKGLKLVSIAYGNEVPSQDYQQTQDLVEAYPDLKGIISPTAQGLPDAARTITTLGKCGQIQLTGEGLPGSMKSYVESGCVKTFGLWNPVDLGTLAVYTMHRLLQGNGFTAKVGQTFDAGSLGKRTVVASSSGNVVYTGPAIKFDKSNINNNWGF